MLVLIINLTRLRVGGEIPGKLVLGAEVRI